MRARYKSENYESSAGKLAQIINTTVYSVRWTPDETKFQYHWWFIDNTTVGKDGWRGSSPKVSVYVFNLA